MTVEIQAANPRNNDPLGRLEGDKTQRLRTLMKLRPGERRYKQSLRAFLDADHALQKAIERFVDGRSRGRQVDRPAVKPSDTSVNAN